MNRPRIVVTSPSFSKNAELRDELLKLFPGTVFNTQGTALSGRALIDFVGGADAAVVGLETIDRNFLEGCSSLRMISKYGVGLDNVDEEACRQRGVKVGWTGGVNRLSVAEQTLAFMIGLERNLFRTCVELKSGVWNKNGGTLLSGKTVGLVGLGHVGKEVVRFLQPFGCTVLANDIVDLTDYAQKQGVRMVSKEELFQQSDIVSIHVPLTSQTRGMVQSKLLSLMKPSAYLINTARGGIVNLSDLKDFLTSGRIAGAALDVYETEPMTDLQFLNLPGLVCTPHIGGNAREAILAMGRSAITHLQTFFGQKDLGQESRL